MWARRLVRAVAIGVLLAAGSLDASASLPTDAPDQAPVARAAGDRGVLQVTMRTAVSRPAERYEFLIGTPVESSDRATLELMSLVAGAWPSATLELVRGTAVQPFSSFTFGPRTRPRLVRASLPGPLTDAALREQIDLLLRAVNARPAGDALAFSRIVGLADGYASCAPFDVAATTMAASMSLDDARSLGEPVADVAAISDATVKPLYMDLSPPANPLCSVADHLTRSTEIPPLTSGAFTDERTMRVIRTVHFALPHPVSPQNPPSMFGSPGDVSLAARFDGPVLTLDGDAYARPVVTRTTYVYRGPLRPHPFASVTVAGADRLRRRIVGLGLAESSVSVTVSPETQYVVVVHANAPSRDDAIVTAIAGHDPLERAAVVVRATSAGCSDDAHLLPAAVADADGRARRVAALLGTTADPRPVAVVVDPPTSSACSESDDVDAGPEAPIPLARAAAGAVRPASLDRRVAAAFRLNLPRSIGTPSPETAPDDRDFALLQTKMAHPSIVAADPAQVSEARRELTRPAEAIGITFDVSPDNAHDFHPISTALVPKLAADLGVPIDALDVAFIPPISPLIPGDASGAVYPPSLRVVVRLANGGAASAADVLAALRDVAAVGYGGVRALTERRDCVADADLLARDTIRAALRGVPGSHATHVIAIELHGPYVVEGSCRADDAGRETDGLGPDPRVRLAAYARVAYR